VSAQFSFGNVAAQLSSGSVSAQLSFGNVSARLSFGDVAAQFSCGNVSAQLSFGNVAAHLSFGNVAAQFSFGNVAAQFSFRKGAKGRTKNSLNLKYCACVMYLGKHIKVKPYSTLCRLEETRPLTSAGLNRALRHGSRFHSQLWSNFLLNTAQ
jgi:hypothetical protein